MVNTLGYQQTICGTSERPRCECHECTQARWKSMGDAQQQTAQQLVYQQQWTTEQAANAQ